MARKPAACLWRGMVGLGRLELPTSRLSSARSNQLSYKPKLLAQWGALHRSRQTANAPPCSPKSARPYGLTFKKKEKRRRRRPANSALKGRLFQVIR